MSTRERWIVYPLLFLTLGIVMRDKVFPQRHFQANDVTAERIHCGQLQVEQVASAGGIAVRRLQCSDEMAAGKIRCGQLQVDGGVAAGGSPFEATSPTCRRWSDRDRSTDAWRDNPNHVARRGAFGSSPAH